MNSNTTYKFFLVACSETHYAVRNQWEAAFGSDLRVRQKIIQVTEWEQKIISTHLRPLENSSPTAVGATRPYAQHWQWVQM